MLSKWPIRGKLLLGAALLLGLVATLSASGIYGLYAYRGLVKTLSGRSTELPLAAELSQKVSELRLVLAGVSGQHQFLTPSEERSKVDTQLLRERFRMTQQEFEDTLARYRVQLDANSDRVDARIGDDRPERQTLSKIEKTLERIDRANNDQDWIFDAVKTEQLTLEVEELHRLATELPSHFRDRLAALAQGVRNEYRAALVLAWVATVAAGVTFIVLVRLFYSWIFCPLRVLIQGSRQVAAGNFDHRIQLQTHDEMSELADAMNDMTNRFQDICDDLDDQVRQRTKQVVRSEQLASVGFLAAGVAHEINNPLASIALCSESLESRVSPLLIEGDDDSDVVRTYLRMIQDEAFRCKGITEKLLDFSRMGDVQHQRTELRELVHSVIDMVGHMGNYRNKQVVLQPGSLLFAEVSPQEMKQVVLNLLTNGLDSVDSGGQVTVELSTRGNQAEIVFTDDGCGMTEEVLEHLFEPFFTRRRGGEGTGLGLSITFRIIADHNGHIEASSEGRGKGSRIVITLPLCDAVSHEENGNRYQAA